VDKHFTGEVYETDFSFSGFFFFSEIGLSLFVAFLIDSC